MSDSANKPRYGQWEHLRARRYFREDNGPGPYECFFCQKTIVGEHEVHHFDHDDWNNAPENLLAVHGSCHATYHAATKHDPELKKFRADRDRARAAFIKAKAEQREKFLRSLRSSAN